MKAEKIKKAHPKKEPMVKLKEGTLNRKCTVCLTLKDKEGFDTLNFTRGGSCIECNAKGRTLPFLLPVNLEKMRQLVLEIEKSTLGYCYFCKSLVLKNRVDLAHFVGFRLYCNVCFLLNRHLNYLSIENVKVITRLTINDNLF